MRLRLGVFGGLDIDAARGAGCGTQKAADAFLESVFIALQDVNATITRLKVDGLVGIIFGDRSFANRLRKVTLKPFSQSCERVADFSDDCHIV